MRDRLAVAREQLNEMLLSRGVLSFNNVQNPLRHDELSLAEDRRRIPHEKNIARAAERHFLVNGAVPSMDSTGEKSKYLVRAECFGCPSQCEMSFTSPVKLSFAFGGKLVGAFSSLCAKLDAVLAQNQEKPDGQKQAELFVEGGE